MPRAEIGSTKYLSNKLKSKGLQRLRWYCQVCERQMRDENGFKCHTQSESHVRQMLVVGENSGKYIAEYSRQFLGDFLQLLRTSHGTKSVHINHFYQEYIANKQHIHMNATQWSSLTQFAQYLGKEGICRVSENEKGVFISWVNNTPAELQRRDALRRKARLEKGDEERERQEISQQVMRAYEQKGKRRREEYRQDQERDEDLNQEYTKGERMLLPQGMKEEIGVKDDGMKGEAEEGKDMKGIKEQSSLELKREDGKKIKLDFKKKSLPDKRVGRR